MLLRYRRMPIEIESPEERGYDTIDANLTESSFADATMADLGVDPKELANLLLCYGDHLGAPALRAEIVDGADGLTLDDVVVTTGAAHALFLVATTLLGPGQPLVVVRPNYATNLETPSAMGADVRFLDLAFDAGWRLDLDHLADLITDGGLVSITTPHNPTGTTLTAAELEALVQLVESRRAWLLVDETYRELAHGEPLPQAASLSPRVVAVSSVSKAHGLPGLRVGWATTRDRDLRELLLAAKEQTVICGSTIDEHLAWRALQQRPTRLPRIAAVLASHLTLVRDWVEREPAVSWVAPSGGAVCFPRLDESVDPARFSAALNARGTFVGPGHWFDQPAGFFRLGYGWPGTAELERGLVNLSAAIATASDRLP